MNDKHSLFVLNNINEKHSLFVLYNIKTCLLSSRTLN